MPLSEREQRLLDQIERALSVEDPKLTSALRGPVGPESRRTLCDLLILVDEAAEAVASSDLVDLGWRAAGEWS